MGSKKFLRRQCHYFGKLNIHIYQNYTYGGFAEIHKTIKYVSKKISEYAECSEIFCAEIFVKVNNIEIGSVSEKEKETKQQKIAELIKFGGSKIKRRKRYQLVQSEQSIED